VVLGRNLKNVVKNKHMKNNIILIILTAIILMGFTGVESGLITIKPAVPKKTIVFVGNFDVVKTNMTPYIQKGFVVKSTTSYGIQYNAGVSAKEKIFVVMEKY